MTLEEYSQEELDWLFRTVMEEYARRLNAMWDTDGYFIDDNYNHFDVADCIISDTEVFYIVRNNVTFDDFLEWYNYDMQCVYGQQMGHEVSRTSLRSWMTGFPEDQKVPEETRKAWEDEYWANI